MSFSLAPIAMLIFETCSRHRFSIVRFLWLNKNLMVQKHYCTSKRQNIFIEIAFFFQTVGHFFWCGAGREREVAFLLMMWINLTHSRCAQLQNLTPTLTHCNPPVSSSATRRSMSKNIIKPVQVHTNGIPV